MNTSTTTIPEASPADQLLGCAHAALALGLQLALACAGGLIAARLLRRRGLHWSWLLVMLLAALPISGAFGGPPALVLAGAGLLAARGARRRHLVDLEVGGAKAGLAVIAIDPKGDRGLREELRGAAIASGRRFQEWSPCGPGVYNPYGRGGDTEIADRVLAGERFTEPHYLRQAQRYLGHAVRALRAAGREVSLAEIVGVLEPEGLELALRQAPERQAESGGAYLDSLTARQLRDLAGIRDRLAILAESDVGRWLDPAARSAPRVELMGAIQAGSVVYFDLESDSRPLLSRMLGAAIVQDLQSIVASLQRAPAPALVMIDEFSAVAAEQVVALFGRARSAGLWLLLGTQELSDLRLPGRELLLEQVLGNLSLLIAHRQVVPASIDLIARLGGSRQSWRVSWSSNGRTTRTPSVEPVLAAQSLTELAPGWGVVIPFGRAEGARVARIERQGAGR